MNAKTLARELREMKRLGDEMERLTNALPDRDARPTRRDRFADAISKSTGISRSECLRIADWAADGDSPELELDTGKAELVGVCNDVGPFSVLVVSGPDGAYDFGAEWSGLELSAPRRTTPGKVAWRW